jgi:hypothetical protein
MSWKIIHHKRVSNMAGGDNGSKQTGSMFYFNDVHEFADSMLWFQGRERHLSHLANRRRGDNGAMQRLGDQVVQDTP